MLNNFQGKKFLKGNEAIAYGALTAGCRCYFGYPITPQNDIPEIMSWLMPETGGAFVQTESEIAAANALLGSVACGVRAMTSSSGPGISLMQESISYQAGSGLPGVFVNISRGGPGLGDIGPSQADYFQAVKGGGHGDYHLLTLSPSSCQEAYDLTIDAFDLAFKYRHPVMILGDAVVGQMKEPVVIRKPAWPSEDEAADWRLDGAKGRPPRAIYSLFLNDGELAGQNLRIQQKYKEMKQDVRFESLLVEDAELVIVAFGYIGRIAKTIVRSLRKQGHPVGLLRPITLFPFPTEELARLAGLGKHFLTIENNMGQMVEDVRLATGKSDFFCLLPGNLPSPDDFFEPILASLAQASLHKK